MGLICVYRFVLTFRERGGVKEKREHPSFFSIDLRLEIPTHSAIDSINNGIIKKNSPVPLFTQRQFKFTGDHGARQACLSLQRNFEEKAFFAF